MEKILIALAMLGLAGCAVESVSPDYGYDSGASVYAYPAYSTEIVGRPYVRPHVSGEVIVH